LPTVTLATALALATSCGGAAMAPFRVCADPSNLPFSNQAREGFENKLAEIVAAELHTTVEYTWWAQRRGFVRNTLGAGRCDAIMGVPVGFDPTIQTRPYYRSTYVFVTRPARHLEVHSFDDRVLRDVRVGVHTAGDDNGNVPPAVALARRGIIQNVVGYSLYGDYATPNPPARLVEAVTRGDVDVAIVWGPLGGYFGTQQAEPLTLTPVQPQADGPAAPFVFEIAVGVRRGNTALRDRLNEVLEVRVAEIERLLAEFHIPLADAPPVH
jgi:quinoprotein dehydrogenase-associated probable ABC transporter substrate-binding protein